MINKKIIVVLIMFTAIGLAAGYVVKVSGRVPAFNSSEFTVILDAGHGEPDGGATGVNGTVEKDVNIAIVSKIQEVFEGKGIKVILTRDGDSGLQDESEKTIRKMKVSDMRKRRDIMEKSKADLFISIHMNYFPKSNVRGLRIFYAKNHPETKELAEKVQEGISKASGAESYAIKTADEKLFLMKNPSMPALLIECGFLSNPDEEKKLNDEDYRAKIAWAIADTVEKYYELK